MTTTAKVPARKPTRPATEQAVLTEVYNVSVWPEEIVRRCERGEWGTALEQLRTMQSAVARAESALVGQMRADGATWQQVADALGTTSQAAHKRYASQVA